MSWTVYHKRESTHYKLYPWLELGIWVHEKATGIFWWSPTSLWSERATLSSRAPRWVNGGGRGPSGATGEPSPSEAQGKACHPKGAVCTGNPLLAAPIDQSQRAIAQQDDSLLALGTCGLQEMRGSFWV